MTHLLGKHFYLITLMVLSNLIFIHSPAMARTAAMQSIADTGAAITASLNPDVLKSPTERYIEECNRGVENYRVHTAAIYGDNNLDDNPYKTQCESPLGSEAPPTGLFIKIRNGQEMPMASGDLVMKNDIVVTAAHLFYDDGEGRVLPTDKLVFAIYEKDRNGICRRNQYPIESFEAGTKFPERVGDLGDDFAVVKLARPVLSYEPLTLPTEAEFQQYYNEIVTGEDNALLSAFGGHASIGDTKDLTVVSGDLFPITDRRHPLASASNAVVHDIDTVPGMSGGSLSVQKDANEDTFILVNNQSQRARYVRYFMGVHKGAISTGEGVEFNEFTEFSWGLLLNDKMRSMIEDAAGTNSVIHTAEGPAPKKQKRTN